MASFIDFKWNMVEADHVLVRQVVQGALLRSMALVMDRGAVLRSLGLPADGLHTRLLRW